MKFIKKNIKLIIGFVVGVILASGVTVFATYQYFATDVEYAENKSVKQALDELYANKKDVSELNTLKTNINQTDATANDIMSGKKAYTKNGLIEGTYTPLTTTKGSEWNYGSFTSVNGENQIPVNFEPNRIIIINKNNGIALYYDKSVNENQFYYSRPDSSAGSISNVSSSITSTDIREIGSTTKIYLTTAGNPWYWFATK